LCDNNATRTYKRVPFFPRTPSSVALCRNNAGGVLAVGTHYRLMANEPDNPCEAEIEKLLFDVRSPPSRARGHTIYNYNEWIVRDYEIENENIRKKGYRVFDTTVFSSYFRDYRPKSLTTKRLCIYRRENRANSINGGKNKVKKKKKKK
jgi:hypothetical protein